ncbi:hypothetical protein GWK47_007858 [Chionoecetes opilio]|uniref:Uncharacterized protein n=1 Tax=Chionoecetes opilio TaxID=41210 RepID=A0A8J4XZS6_CHIOP|nr:hypothetical protein GWK47_007858 [Chionoecetes opilio]
MVHCDINERHFRTQGSRSPLVPHPGGQNTSLDLHYKAFLQQLRTYHVSCLSVVCECTHMVMTVVRKRCSNQFLHWICIYKENEDQQMWLCEWSAAVCLTAPTPRHTAPLSTTSACRRLQFPPHYTLSCKTVANLMKGTIFKHAQNLASAWKHLKSRAMQHNFGSLRTTAHYGENYIF